MKKYGYLKYGDELANETHTNKIIMQVRLHTSSHTQKRDQGSDYGFKTGSDYYKLCLNFGSII